MGCKPETLKGGTSATSMASVAKLRRLLLRLCLLTKRSKGEAAVMRSGRNGDGDSIMATVLVRVGAEVDGLDVGRKSVVDGVARSEGGG
jgi:hypothetical protein